MSLVRGWMSAYLCLAACTSHADTPGHASFETACAPTSSIALPQTAVGQTVMVAVQIINEGTTDLATSSFAIAGSCRLRSHDRG